MNKANQKNNRFDEKLGVGFGIACVTILVLFILLLSNYLKPIPETYFINFYEQDELITTERLNVGTTISESRLDAIAKSRFDGIEYEYGWSYSKDKYRKVSFELLNKDTNVYLFKYLNEFDIEVVESNLYDYEIISDGPVIKGSDAHVKIHNKHDSHRYHMSVYANNQLIEENDDGIYLIENINEDIIIHVEYLEILYLTPLIEDTYVYDSSPKDIGYIIKDYQDQVVDIVNTNDILINYYNSSGDRVDKILNAGTYKLEMIYQGKEFYIEPVTKFITVDKAKPDISVHDKFVYYDGTPQGFNSADIETNSDGLIEFINNSNTDVGVYKVEILIKESNNYLSIKTEAYLNIQKGKVNISENPIADVGFEGHILNDVGFKDGITNTEGIFMWKDKDQVLDVGIKEYLMVFIPNDPNYESSEFLVEVETISYEEQLNRIKSERERILEDKEVFDGDKFITKSQELHADIIWMSLSSALMVDSGGNVSIIGSPGTYTVDIIGIMMFGDSAEYITISVNIVIDTGGGINLTLL